MSLARSKPVWVWPPGRVTPVQCGVFALDRGVGSLRYTDDYKATHHIALDPVVLPVTHREKPYKETRQMGVFGVIRDAMPEGYGLQLLETMTGRILFDPMDRLELSIGDATGAIEVCDDIDRKVAYAPVPLDELLAALHHLSPTQPSSAAAREVHGMQGTSLGGERPKLTVLQDGALWIAKLQDRGDAPNTPLREYLAMRVGARLGLRVSEVRYLKVDDRQVLLVKRFDRKVSASGIERSLFASAHTVLRLDAELRGDVKRSYVWLAKSLKRWAPHDSGSGPELWKRMAYNALCGNGDDHPRNHGVIHDGAQWALSPAFDIAPAGHPSGVQSMSVNRDGALTGGRISLLKSCSDFDMDLSQASAFLDGAQEAFPDLWADEAKRVGEDASRAAAYVWNPENDGPAPQSAKPRLFFSKPRPEKDPGKDEAATPSPNGTVRPDSFSDPH